MEYFNSRSPRCTSCMKCWSFQNFVQYELFDDKKFFLDSIGANKMCCRNLFISPNADFISKQSDECVYRYTNRHNIKETIQPIPGVPNTAVRIERLRNDSSQYIMISDNRYEFPIPSQIEYIADDNLPEFPEYAGKPTYTTEDSNIRIVNDDISNDSGKSIKEIYKRTYLIF